MNIDEFKLIIDAVKTVSGDAQSVAIWWIVADKLIPVIAWLIAGFGLYKISVRLCLMLRSASDMCEIRDILGIGTRGPLIERERNEIFKTIKSMKDAKSCDTP